MKGTTETILLDLKLRRVSTVQLSPRVQADILAASRKKYDITPDHVFDEAVEQWKSWIAKN